MVFLLNIDMWEQGFQKHGFGAPLAPAFAKFGDSSKNTKQLFICNNLTVNHCMFCKKCPSELATMQRILIRRLK